MKSGKEIAKFKIALTSRCCLRCDHCFINKDRVEKMTMVRAGKGLELFLGSPGRDKLLEIYGGEPLLEFGLLKKIAAGARALAVKLGKRLSVSVASNGILAEKRHLDYMAENGIRFSISFSGGRETHDLTRRFPSGRGTFAVLEKKAPLFLSALGSGLHVIFCVHPLRAAAAFSDFRRLVELGFRNIGIECVHGFPWRPRDHSAFAAAMARITAFTAEKAAAGDFIALEPLLEFFREKSGAGSFCPFLRDLEMYPDGTLSLYPYPFVKTAAQRKKAAVGSAAAGMNARFRGCVPVRGSAACGNCVDSYYRLPGLGGGSRAYRLRTDICMKAAESLAARSTSEPAVREYLKSLIKLFKKGHS